MSLEGLTPSIPHYKELKEQFKQRLDAILYKKITVENIETFADEALNELVDLNRDILDKYEENLPFGPQLDVQRQENDAYKQLELPNIQEILESVDEVRDKIANAKENLIKNKIISDRVITPPQEEYKINHGNGEGLRQLGLFPRLLTLAYILETDFEINQDAIHITEGSVTKDMMRKEPYVRVEIPDLNRAVYLCDEEGNASYVFDTEKLESLRIPLNDLDIDDKRDKNTLIAMQPGAGIRMIQTKNWRKNMSAALSEPIPERPAVSLDTMEEFERVRDEERHSEFFVAKEWLLFDKFQIEVRDTFNKETIDISNLSKWYKNEYKKHKDWPSKPFDAYKNKGWEGWSELVGRENRKKRNWPVFEDFQREVRAQYPGQGNVQGWYKTEYNKHKNWPSDPREHYLKSGWIDWSELVGRENRLKKEYLPFVEFQKEVKTLYPGIGSVQDWYKKEREKHFHWPSQPAKIYKEEGWLGFPELVGIENKLKMEWLSFEDFQAEVRSVYAGEGDVEKWYFTERKKHSGWHTQPYLYYEDSGWLGWPELVGKENLLKRERLSFGDFQREVMALYPGEGDVQKWYKTEYKKHRDWPAGPRNYYSNSGWIDWSELVGKENPSKKDFPNFETFQTEVKSFYRGESSVKDWYKSEYKKHKNWPSNPSATYGNKGWVSWPKLARD